MENKSNTPFLRFRGYTDAWGQERLNELVTYSSSSLTASDALENGLYPLYDANAQIGFTNKEPIREDYITIIKDGAGVGRIRKLKKNTLFIGTMGALVPSSSDYGFVYALLSRFDLSGSHTGSTIPHIYFKDYGKQEYLVPKLEEQAKIGSLFTGLDDLLSLHQRKLEKLQEIKKSLLQNMFPAEGEDRPKIRFGGYTDAWGQERLGEMLVKNDERNKDVAFDNVESVSNKTGFTKQTEQFDDYSVASADLSNYYVIRERQFAYNPSRINVGSIAYKEKGAEIGVVSPLYISFSTKEMLDDRFLWYWFKTYSFDYQRHTLSEGGVRDTLSFDKIAQMEIKLPGLKEQQEIGRVLHSVDSLLSLHQRKLEKLQQIKKALLEQMFC